MNTPLVSVLLPVYNGEKYIREAVDSILGQSYHEIELLVIDDGSQDETLEVLETYSDPRLRVLVNEKNRGVAVSLNRGIRESRGQFIARMDSDDIARKHRIARQVEFLEKHPELSICGGAMRCFFEKNGKMSYPLTHSQIRAQCLFNTPFAHPVVCWRKSDFEKEDLFYQEDPPTAEDYQLWERATRKLKAANLKEILLDYRIDTGIKISAYLAQQLEGAKLIRESQLSAWAKDISSEEIELHHQISEGSSCESFDEMHRKVDWLYKIHELNEAHELVNREALAERVSHYIYSLLVSNLSLGSLKERSRMIKRKEPVDLSMLVRVKLLIRRC